MKAVLILDGQKIRNINEIPYTCDTFNLLRAFYNGTLASWLEENGYPDEAKKVRNLGNEHSDEIAEQLLKMFNLSLKEHLVGSQAEFERRLQCGVFSVFVFYNGRYKLDAALLEAIKQPITVMAFYPERVMFSIPASQSGVAEKMLIGLGNDFILDLQFTSDEDYLTRAKVRYLSAHFEEALQDLDKIDNRSKNESYYLLRGRIYKELHQFDKAIEALSVYPNDGDAQFECYLIYSSLREKKRAQEYLKNAAELSCVEAMVMYARSLMGKVGTSAEILRLLEAAVDKQSVDGAITLADCYMRGKHVKKDLNKAERCCNDSLKYATKEDERKAIHTKLGEIYLCKKQPERVKESLAESSDPDALIVLGNLYAKEKNIRLAVNAYKRAADHGKPDGLLRASTLLSKHGTTDSMTESYELAMRYIKSSDGDSRAKKTLFKKQINYWRKESKNSLPLAKQRVETLERLAKEYMLNLPYDFDPLKDAAKNVLGVVGPLALSLMLGAITKDSGSAGKGGNKRL
ncbi:MAG: hypothetical protein HDT15_12015 [Oscillibacter sp.]|nr:hypothetical protein [Oscillibacter sp.]